MTARVELHIKGYDDAIRIPMEAVQYNGGAPYVTLRRAGEQKQQAVKTGLNDGDIVVIESGLQANDHVLIGNRTNQ